MAKKTGLGQGVGLLFNEEQEKYFDCEISKIVPNKHQPRTNFNEQELDELALSIKENGVIQPLIVTYNTIDDNYELVAGERRLRASKIAGLNRVPVVVIEVEREDTLLELALIENIQRTDLNPIEEAEAYRKLIEKFGYTQEETAKKVGKQRSTVTNMLRLLKLPDSIQKDISCGILSEGHGRALIRLSEEPLKILEIRDLIVKNNLSVRQSEKIIKKISLESSSNKKTRSKQFGEAPEAYINSLITQLTNFYNTKVAINQNDNRGKIELEYFSLDDLERLISLLLK